MDEGANGARLDTVSISGGTLDTGEYPELELLDCELTGVLLTTSNTSRLDIVDSVLTDCDLSRVRLGPMRGARLVGCKLAGTDFCADKLRDSLLERCTLQYANLRMTTIERVGFCDCVLDDTDFYEAALDNVTFDGSELKQVNLDRTRFERVDLRRAISVDLIGGPQLSGCLISEAQVQELAYTLALAAGATIERSATS